MKKKGFTLTELIGAIVILSIIIVLAVVSFVGIRKSVLQGQYDNLIEYISAKAANYTEETGELNVTVERLIETGYLEPDKANNIYDPRDNKSINCYIFDSIYENGNYNAKLGSDIGFGSDGKCNKYEVKKEMQICVREQNSSFCNPEILPWYNRNVTLSVIIGGNQNLVNNASVVWKADGIVTNGPTYETKVSKISKGTYTAAIKYEELKADGTKKVIEGNEIASINIDLEKPAVKSVNVSKEDQWTNTDKQVVVKMTDYNGSGIGAVKIIEGNTHCADINDGWTVHDGDTFTTELNSGVYNVCAQDLAGNVSDDYYFEVKKVDKVLPECTVNVSSTPNGENGWYTSKPVNISLTVSDNNEGNLARGLVKGNNEVYYNNVRSISHNEDSNNLTYYGFVKDIAGNEASCSASISVDTVNPTCSINITGDKLISGSDWYTSNVTISLSETKGTSDIIGHNLTTSSTASYKTEDIDTVTQGSTTGTTYYGYVKGESGRTGSCSKSVKVDTVKPGIGAISVENNNGTSVIKTTLTDSGSKLAKYAVTKSNSEPTSWTTISGNLETYNLAYNATSGGTYYVWVKDNAGNVRSSSTSVTISYTQVTKVRYENADGTWGSYTEVDSKMVNSGDTYSWSTSQISGFDSTTYQAASVTSYTVSSDKTNNVSIYRKTFTCKIDYKLQKADATYATSQSGTNSTLRYGQTCSWSRSADATYQAASYSTTITSNVDQTVNVLRNTFTITKRYRLQGTDGNYPSSYTNDGTATVLYGSSYTYKRNATTSHQEASAISSNVTADAILSLDVPRNVITCNKRYRLQNADGTWGSYTNDGTTNTFYGGSCSYSKSVTNYKGSSSGTNGSAGSASATNVTSVQTLSIDMYRNTFTCSKQYRLEGADGTWGSYTADGSETALYGGSCSYSKSVTNYKGSSSGTNGSAGSASATNVTSAKTLSIDLYRNTYTLTVSAGTNTSSATGGGSKRWGQSVAVGVTKSADTTCVKYAAPTWTASTGTAPAAGASSTYTMPKSNATVTATSAASNVSQTITLTKGTGVTGISIAGTSYTGTSVSLTCGTYNISGSYSTGYNFGSWAKENNIAVTSTTTASTSMTVSGAGSLTLNAKAKTYTVTLNKCSATNSPSTSATATYNATTLSAITVPTRSYTVSGFTKPAGNNADGATVSSTSNVTSAYTFNGWYTGTCASPGTKVASNAATPALQASVSGYTDSSKRWTKDGTATLYASWTSKAVTLPTITKSGYTCGWTTTSSGATSITYASGGSMTPTADTTLYGVCIIKNNLSLKINFAGSGVSSVVVKSGSATGTTVGTVSSSGGSVSNLTSGTTYYLVPTYSTGYTLSKWANDSGSVGTLSSTSAANPSFTIGDGTNSVTLTGKAKTYTVTLNKCSATNSPSTSATATYYATTLSAITLPTRSYTISGFTKPTGNNASGATVSSTSTLTSTYTFNGWYTGSCASPGTKVASNAATPALQASVSGYTDSSKRWTKDGTATLYAGWTGQAKTLPTITLTGNDCGWTTTSTGATSITYASGGSMTPTANTTLYGVCVPKTFDITFSFDSGITSITVKQGSTTVGTVSTSGSSIGLKYNTAYTITVNYKSGYTSGSLTKVSGSGTLSGTTFTVGNGVASISATSTINGTMYWNDAYESTYDYPDGVPTGSGIHGMFANLSDLATASINYGISGFNNHKIHVKSVMSNGSVSSHTVCAVAYQGTFCIQKNYWTLKSGVSVTSALQKLSMDIQNVTGSAPQCSASGSPNTVTCQSGGIIVSIVGDGTVGIKTSGGSLGCLIDSSGNAFCRTSGLP